MEVNEQKGMRGGIDYDYKNLYSTPEPIPNYVTGAHVNGVETY